MDRPHTYDYIIAGAGAAGLSLAYHLIHSNLSDKKILVVDQDLSPSDDKTWCFWHEGSPLYPEVIHKSWKQAEVYVQETEIKEELRHFPYYCIKSGDFQQYVLEELKQRSNVDLIESPILKMAGNRQGATLSTEDNNFEASYIFQSCFAPPQLDRSKIQYPLIQHFLGWEIEADQPVFNHTSFILMDIDETYENGMAFIYLLPWSEHKALIEYTIFSPSVEEAAFYEKKLELYLFNRFKLKRFNYNIEQTEYGEIPMQDTPYLPTYDDHIINMGTVGGLTKPSTGYTFSRIQNHARAIVEGLLKDGKPALPPKSDFRYRAYDLWLLQILHDNPEKGISVFHDLFANNSVDGIFKFLGERTSVSEDLKIMSSVPYAPFFKAIWKTRKRLLEI